MEIQIVGSVSEAKKVAGEGPFRAPHHTCSEAALVSEVALATGGVLFLDELTLFAPGALRRALGVVRSMSCHQHPHTPRVVATVGNATLATLLDAGFNLSLGRVK